jgi:hypothetical protein
MATTILGTFPILNSKKSQTDEYGFDYLSYQYTIKTSDLAKYNIKKDDVFTGIESWNGTSFARSPSVSGSTYVVDDVQTDNVEGGLTDLTVNTVGTKNSIESNSPRVVLISGGPLIFGLSGTPPAPAKPFTPSSIGYGVAGAGQSIEVKFLANGGTIGQQEIFTQFFSSLMPATFRGLSLPAPAKPPHTISVEFPSGDSTIKFNGYYYGFVCKTILTEKRGSLLLVTLTFSEAGLVTRTIRTPTEVTSSAVYDFPRVG